ncbi:hypothetical protein C7C46_13245 [Streptomyces tateyamensis]|uniref:YncI copper-binding domain-containing protein n=1 Tax=Streptomyces tateyamensis TaxID=565073 RepID=A0A2V4P9X7_9ACTN|nr:DUF1775 domain-containing protein [Streptomyces tateyamensis]PYC80247.1 hypothetical protein C7C46_13245 [Streptomyces tateyamensis]
MKTPRVIGRAAVLAAVALGGSVLAAGSAFAHVEVSATQAQALASNVTLTFTAEAESPTAGLASFRVVLPDGIAPGDVTLAGAPQGWTFAATDDGFTVGGTALPPGTNASYQVAVRQLPSASELVFKTLETYGDGHVERWIELTKGGAEPDHPAPVLKLSAAAPGASPAGAGGASASAGGPSAAPSGSAGAGAGSATGGTATAGATPSAPAAASPSTPPSAPASVAPAAKSGGGSSVTVPVAIAVVVVLALVGGGAWWWRRRQRSTGA